MATFLLDPPGLYPPGLSPADDGAISASGRKRPYDAAFDDSQAEPWEQEPLGSQMPLDEAHLAPAAELPVPPAAPAARAVAAICAFTGVRGARCQSFAANDSDMCRRHSALRAAGVSSSCQAEQHTRLGFKADQLVFKKEQVNWRAVEVLCSYDDASKLRIGDMPARLYAQLKLDRVQKNTDDSGAVVGDFGTLSTSWREMPSPLNKPIRRMSGLPYSFDVKHLPRQLAHERACPSGLLGVSVFEGPRWLRAAFRCGVDGADVDLVAAHIQVQAMRHGTDAEVAYVLNDYVENCQATRRELANLCGIDAKEVKKIFQKVQYGFPLSVLAREFGPLPDYLVRFAEVQEKIRKTDGAASPSDLQKFAQEDDPLVSLQAHLNMVGERELLDSKERIAKWFGIQMVSYEHDGAWMVGRGNWHDEFLGALRDKGIRATVKPTPQTFEELLVYVRQDPKCRQHIMSHRTSKNGTKQIGVPPVPPQNTRHDFGRSRDDPPCAGATEPPSKRP
jgi:hypothetical protein